MYRGHFLTEAFALRRHFVTEMFCCGDILLRRHFVVETFCWGDILLRRRLLGIYFVVETFCCGDILLQRRFVTETYCCKYVLSWRRLVCAQSILARNCKRQKEVVLEKIRLWSMFLPLSKSRGTNPSRPEIWTRAGSILRDNQTEGCRYTCKISSIF
jgi:hypothetical protein